MVGAEKRYTLHQPTKEHLHALFEVTASPCLSFYLHVKGAETALNPIRLKNLLRQAREQLSEAGWEEKESKKLLRPVSELADQYGFWQNHAGSLALFLTADQLRLFQVDWPVPELCVIGGRFHLRPLVPALATNGIFYLLVLSTERPRLYRGSRTELVDITPESLQDYFRDWVVPEGTPELQAHSCGRSELFHTDAGGGEMWKVRLKEALHRMNRELEPVLRAAGAPVVVAGVDYLRALYREAGPLPHVIEESISGSVDRLAAHELQEKARAAIERHLLAQRRLAAQRFEQAAPGQSSTDPQEVIPAAFQGRVMTLFVAADRQLWGKFDEATQTIRISASRGLDDEDLLDAAALRTYLAQGTVFTVPQQEVPGGGWVAALYRF